MWTETKALVDGYTKLIPASKRIQMDQKWYLKQPGCRLFLLAFQEVPGMVGNNGHNINGQNLRLANPALEQQS